LALEVLMPNQPVLRAPHGFSARRWKALLLGTALPAVAMVSAPGTAWAQSEGLGAFRGNHEVAAGSATRAVSPGAETITVNTPSAIINWTPTDIGPIADFLPAGNVATFQNGGETSNFAVLNRILPTVEGQLIAFNGRVISQLQTAAGTVRGGSIAFYTPNGLIIGSNAVFDVGNLTLTTLDPQSFDSFAFGGLSRFSALNPLSSVTVMPGAQINATAANSYVAILSPKISMGGAVRVDGSAAYAAGEVMDISVFNGLFNITIPTGTTDAAPITHTGSTGGPASSGAGDNHQIVMVAVPKNQAITMLLSGSMGYDGAANATVQNGQIVLGAGHNYTNGSLRQAAGVTEGSLLIDGGSVTSNLEARAVRDATVQSRLTAFSATGDVTLFGGSSVNVIAEGQGASLAIGRRLRAGSFSNTTSQAGAIRVAALQGGQVTVTGTTELFAENAFSLFFDRAAGAPPILTGGTATIEADGGTLSFGNNVTVSANGNSFGTAADETGGTIAIRAAGGGTIAVAGNLTASAANARFGGTRGTGFGGTVTLLADGGQVNVAGALRMETGISGPFDGGNGIGGTSRLTVRNGGQVSATSLDVSAFGASGGASAAGMGGFGTAGTAEVNAESGGQLTVTNQLLLSASGFGGSGSAAGGNGTGGTARINATGNGRVNAGTIQALANGNGGAGSAGSALGGTGTAGLAELNAATGGRIASNTAALAVTGFGGTGVGGGGAGRGGNATIRVDGALSQVTTASASLNGSSGGGTSANGRGGDASSDRVVVEATNAGAASLGTLSLQGGANGGGGLTGGGDASGGLMRVRAAGGGTITATPSSTNLFAQGGNARDGGGKRKAARS
jgi:hypothetical protein